MAFVELEVADRIATVTMNRPEKLNSWTPPMFDELRDTIADLDARDDVSVIILTGAGRAFAAGADLSGFEAMYANGVDVPGLSQFAAAGRNMKFVLDMLERMPTVVIAAIDGVCAGGGLEVALACDIRYAGPGAKLGLPELKSGLIPAGTGTVRLTKLIGPDRTRELVYTADMIDGPRAAEIGLVTRYVEPSALDHAREVAGRIRDQAPLAVAMAKTIITNAEDAPTRSAFAYEDLAETLLIQTEDHEEGIKAFQEKRRPNFKGR